MLFRSAESQKEAEQTKPEAGTEPMDLHGALGIGNELEDKDDMEMQTMSGAVSASAAELARVKSRGLKCDFCTCTTTESPGTCECAFLSSAGPAAAMIHGMTASKLQTALCRVQMNVSSLYSAWRTAA